MKSTSLFIISFLFCSASFADFQYHFKCRGYGRNQILELKVGTSGLEEIIFKAEDLKHLNSYQLLSQYSDYGSMQFLWQSPTAAYTKANIQLDFASGSFWRGQLTFDGQEQIDLTCADQL